MFFLQQGNFGSPFQKAAKLIVIIDSLPTLKYHGERGHRYVLAERSDWRLEMPFTHTYNDIQYQTPIIYKKVSRQWENNM